MGRSCALGLALLLAGCTTVARQEPAIPVPEFPAIKIRCAEGNCCMSEPDGNLLAKWLHKMFDDPGGFVPERNRLLKSQE